MSTLTPLPWIETPRTREPSHYCRRCNTRGIAYESVWEFALDHLHDATPEQAGTVEDEYIASVSEEA